MSKHKEEPGREKKKGAEKKPAPAQQGSYRESLARKLGKVRAGFSGGDYWNPDHGKNVLRIFSWSPNPDHLMLADEKHWGILAVLPDAPDDADKKPVQCPGRDVCPVCDTLRSAPKDTFPSRYYRRVKWLVNAVVRDSEGTRQVVAQLPLTVGEAIINLMQSIDGIENPKSGRDFTITRRGKELLTKYEVTVAQAASPIGLEVEGKDLEDLIPPVDEALLKKIAAHLTSDKPRKRSVRD